MSNHPHSAPAPASNPTTTTSSSTTTSATPRLIAGCMTGTSIDSIDLALVSITGRALHIQPRFIRHASAPLGPIAPRLRALASGSPTSAADIASLNHDFSTRHAEVLADFLKADRPDLIVVHGQTVFHRPPVSWQLISPAVIAHRTRTPVLFDLRAADLAAGGQGAPITPLADFILFRNPSESRIIVNLGGFCNITHLPRADSSTPTPATTAASIALTSLETELSRIRASDVCACNQLLDSLARSLWDSPYDANGARALAGRVISAAFDELTAALRHQSNSRRSLGTGDELSDWVRQKTESIGRGEDLARTACAAVAHTIASHLGSPDRILLAGGGVKNAALVAELKSRTKIPVSLTDDFAIPSSAREAVAMAVLGALCLDRVPITLPQVTNLSTPAPISGSWVHP